MCMPLGRTFSWKLKRSTTVTEYASPSLMLLLSSPQMFITLFLALPFQSNLSVTLVLVFDGPFSPLLACSNYGSLTYCEMLRHRSLSWRVRSEPPWWQEGKRAFSAWLTYFRGLWLELIILNIFIGKMVMYS